MKPDKLTPPNRLTKALHRLHSVIVASNFREYDDFLAAAADALNYDFYELRNVFLRKSELSSTDAEMWAERIEKICDDFVKKAYWVGEILPTDPNPLGARLSLLMHFREHYTFSDIDRAAFAASYHITPSELEKIIENVKKQCFEERPAVLGQK